MGLGLGRKVKNYLKTQPRIRYIKEKKISAGLPNLYYNWWVRTNSQLKKDWFSTFVSKRIQENHADVLFSFVSVFGHKDIVYYLKKDKYPVIFYTGENVSPTNILESTGYEDHCVDVVDLALGFDYLTHPKYLRFPFWLFNFPPDSTVESVQKQLIFCQQKRLIEKQAFCSLVSSHDKNGLRTKLFNLLNQIAPVDAGGKLLRNTDKLQTQFGNNKISFLENYYFNLCPENSNEEGYVTEKVFDAIFSGTLPIYWGSNNHPEPEVINHEAILFYSEVEPEEVFISKIAELYHNKKLYQEFMAQEIFLPTAAEYIVDKIDTLEIRLRSLLKNS